MAFLAAFSFYSCSLPEEDYFPEVYTSDLADVIINLSGIISYWPLTENYPAGSNLANLDLSGVYMGDIALNTFFPSGDLAVSFEDGDDRILLPISAINDVWNWDNGWLMFWYKTDASAVYGNGIKSRAFQLATSSLTTFYASKSDSSEYGRHVFGIDNSPTTPYFEYSKNQDKWNFVVYKWNASQDIVSLYFDGQRVYSGKFGAAPDSITSVSIGSFNGWRGAFAHMAFGQGNISDKQIENIWQVVYPSSLSILGVGDSKTANENDRWLPLLAGGLTTLTNEMWREAPYRIGLPGARTDGILTYISPRIASATYNPTFIIVSGGANDLSQMVIGTLDSAGWVKRMYPVLERLHSRWPDAKIFWIKPYRDDYSDGRYDKHALNMARWIDFVVSRPQYSYYAYSGINENVWFKPKIAAYSSDRVHYNNEGHLKAVELWIDILADHLPR